MNLPPFGRPPVELRIKNDGARPEHWSGSEADWRAFYDRLVDDIATHLWPRWDPASRRWDGPAAVFAEGATRLENAICIEHLQKTGVLETFPHTPNYAGGPLSQTHYWHYQVEDNINLQAPNPRTYAHAIGSSAVKGVVYYDESLNSDVLPEIFQQMWKNKYNGIFQTKLIFSRPRPQQTAFIFGQEFEHRQALANVHTGNHPAMISGHCAQGLLYMCTLIERHLAAGRPLAEVRTQDYGQYGVDFGDRRVFAGVHYPTDNMASWIAVIRLIPHVFGQNGPVLVDFVKNAIRTQSLVYRIIRETFPVHAPLSHALEFLDTELPQTSA